MSYKRLIALLLSICLLICCVGCAIDKPQNSTEPSNETVADPTIEQGNTINTNPTDNTIGNTEDTQDIIVGNEMVWEKNETQITLETIKISKEWDQFIIVDDAVVSAIEKTDMSVIPNYYFGDNDSYADLQTVYYVPTYRLSSMTDKVDLDKYIAASMDIVCTTNNAEIQKHAIIEEIRFVTMVNPYEGGGIDTLKAKAAYTSNGNFGIGSSYENIVKIIGEASNQTTVPMDEGISLTSCVYVGDNAEMILTFMWVDDSGINSAALTSVNWIATTIGTELHTQEGIELFEKYNKTKHEQIDQPIDDGEEIPTESTEQTGAYE